MKSNISLCLALFVDRSALAANSAKDDVIAAAKKLAGESSYSWKSTVVVPENAQFRPGPTEGKTEKGGMTFVTMSFGENKTEMLIKGQKAAVKGQDGWQSAADLENAAGRGRFMGAMARNFKAPAEQAVEIAGFAKELKKEGDVFSGPLTEDGVKALVNFRRRAGGEPPAVANPSGNAKFWIKDGVLTKFEFHVKGSMTFNNNDFDVDRTTTVEIKDIGKTKVEAPEEGLKKIS
jgi:hypothetical protein